jgi:hypothetical protein
LTDFFDEQANIICPLYRKGTRAADVEKYIIYNVSREEFENCQITTSNPRVIAICDKPHELIYFTITFRCGCYKTFYARNLPTFDNFQEFSNSLISLLSTFVYYRSIQKNYLLSGFGFAYFESHRSYL